MPLQVLLIDDEPDLRIALAEALADAGHQVLEAGDGAEGLAILEARPIDVVICDVRLPRMDGLTVLRHVRERRPAVDVILMTAFAEVTDAVAALKVGAYDYLTKPFEIDELIVQLERIDSHRAVRRELEQARVALAERKADTTIIGQSRAHPPGAAHGRDGRRQRGADAGHRRERHRQGAGGADAARAQHRAGTSRSWWSTAGRSPRR